MRKKYRISTGDTPVLAIMYRPQNTSGLAVEQLFEDEFVLVSSNRDASVDPFGESYVLIDWGFEFRAHHLLNFPQFTTPSLQLGLGTLGLQYLRTVPASGYFPRRAIESEVDAGWLHLIKTHRVLPIRPTLSSAKVRARELLVGLRSCCGDMRART